MIGLQRLAQPCGHLIEIIGPHFIIPGSAFSFDHRAIHQDPGVRSAVIADVKVFMGIKVFDRDPMPMVHAAGGVDVVRTAKGYPAGREAAASSSLFPSLDFDGIKNAASAADRGFNDPVFFGYDFAGDFDVGAHGSGIDSGGGGVLDDALGFEFFETGDEEINTDPQPDGRQNRFTAF